MGRKRVPENALPTEFFSRSQPANPVGLARARPELVTKLRMLKELESQA